LLLGVLRDLGLFALVVLVLLGPVQAFLVFRLRRVTQRGHGHYLASADPWVTVVVALAGVSALALVRALS